jgi:replicative DNA helicase
MDRTADRAVLERVPPRSEEAEQATLGAMLLERDAIARVVSIVGAGDFYTDAHRNIFNAIADLFNEGQGVDVVTLAERLQVRGLLDQIGGQAYLAHLLDAVPTAASAERYANIVRDKAILRDMIGAASRILSRCYDDSDNVPQLVDECESMVFAAGERTVAGAFTSLKPLLSETYDRIERISQSGLPASGLPTGFDEVDKFTSGLQPSDLVILAARPSMGKTAFALNVATHVALRQKLPVAIFSLEMAKEQLALRILCSEALVDQQRIRQADIDLDEVVNRDTGETVGDRLVKWTETLYHAPIYIDDSASLNILEMRGKARRLQAELGGLGLIIVDYLQLMHGHVRYENRTQEISQIARGLKTLARELRVPVLALSQLSRAVELRSPRRPLLSDLRESGSIEAEADVVAFIYRPGYYGEEEIKRADPDYSVGDQRITEIIIAKQRNGPVGVARLAWLGQYVRFRPLEELRVVE